MTPEEEKIVGMYGNELATLKINSKPLINSLTMMAEDNLRNAPLIVQTIEKQLLSVRSNIKLPILYLIDSIIKNVKRTYIPLFTQNIVSVFCSVFEKVDESTRAQMFKLRQTWNDVFPHKKLGSIDMRVHQIDPGWPIAKAPSIHVNPKFLTKGALVLSGSGIKSANPYSLPTLKNEPVDEATEAQMREQLLIKQKELIELQQKKVELELMHAKSQLEEQERMKKAQEGALRQQQLMKQAELAKHQTDKAATLMALAGKSNPPMRIDPSNNSSTSTKKSVVSDPRLNRVREERKQALAELSKVEKERNQDAHKPTIQSRSIEERKMSPITVESINIEESPTSLEPEPKTIKGNRKRVHEVDLFNGESSKHKDKGKHKSSKHKEKERESHEREKDVKVKKESPSPTKSSSSSGSSSGHRRTKLVEPMYHHAIKKERGSSSSSIGSAGSKAKVIQVESDDDYEDEMKGYSALTIKPKRNYVNSPSPDKKSPSKLSSERKDSLPTDSERSRKSSPTFSSPSPTKPSSSNSASSNSSVDRKSKSKDKIPVKVEKESEEHKRGTKRDGKQGFKDRESPRKLRQEREKEQYANRKSAVLSRNYRKRQDPSLMAAEENSGRKSNDPSVSDVDLRFEGLQDVDLRRQGEDDGDQPQAKKSRSSTALIDDLFGQEDVDLRQSSSSWSQVKKPAQSPVTSSSSFVRRDHDGRESPSRGTASFDDIRDDLRDDNGRPPQAPSPANSVGSTRSSCDPLGRPLLFTRLPDDPEDRKRCLDTRSSSIDPVEQFCVRYIDKPSKRIGGLTQSDLSFAASKANQDFNAGLLSSEHFDIILKRLVQVTTLNDNVNLNKLTIEGFLIEVNELEKINQLKQTRAMERGGPQVGNAWPGPRWQNGQNFGPRGPGRFPGGMQRPWGANQWNGPPRPRGPNPFLDALPHRPDDFIPEANRTDLLNAERDVDSSLPLDKVIRQIRFYGEVAIVFVGVVGDEPREISFQKGGPPKIVYVDKEPLKCVIGASRTVYIDKIKHNVRIGTPKRELYIDDQGYETCFGGPPIPIRLGSTWHSFKLEGPPPQVEVGEDKRYDLVAGRVILFIDSNSFPVYLDEKPQLLDLCGFPVILQFSEDFHSITLNGRPFPFQFDPMSITLPNGRQHFLRFASISQSTREAMHAHFMHKMQQKSDGHMIGAPFRGRGRGRGIRGGITRAPGPGFVPLTAQQNPPNRPEIADRISRNRDDVQYMDIDEPGSESNPLDVVASLLPPSSQARVLRNNENAYESDSSFLEDKDTSQQADSTSQKTGGAQAMSVDDLLSQLLMAGILKGSQKEEVDAKETSVEEEVVKPSSSPSQEEKPSEVSAAADSTTLPPLETVDLTFEDNMRERRVKLVDQICTGIQCASCGLRFAPDQTFRYTQHLDWHFRQNRRDKGNFRKALSRKWYYDLSDWIQFEEIEDLEERAASMFEFQEGDAEGDERSSGTILNPDSYTVLAAGHDGALCPQCGEGFETFYDEEEEEWRLRDAFLSPESEGEQKLYHPICHQDYTAALNEYSLMKENSSEEKIEIAMDTTDGHPVEEEDEVLILKEGKKEVVLMEIDVEDDEIHSDSVLGEKKDNEQMLLKNDSNIESNTLEFEKNNNSVENDSLPITATLSSQSILSPFLIHDDEESNSNIPGIFTDSGTEPSGVFGIALGLDSTQIQLPTVEAPNPISYNSWQFDFPKIKIEPPEWDDVDEGQVIMSKDYQVKENQDPLDITLDEEEDSRSSQVVPESDKAVDIDLTEDDEISSSTPVGSLVAEIDGNLDFRGDSLQPLVQPSKIRFNISGLSAISTSSQKGSPSTQGDNPKDSPKSITDSLDTPPESSQPRSNSPDPEIDLEELKRLKPRLVGRKLVNCPVKKTGKEVSGLCVIC